MGLIVIRVRKQVGGSNPKEILDVVANKLLEQMKAHRAARSQTSQPQPQTQAKPLPPPPPQSIPQPPTVTQPQVQAVRSEQLPRPEATGVAERPVSFKIHRSSIETLNYTLRPTVSHLSQRLNAKLSTVR